MSYEAPHEHEAEERAWRLVRAAYETREPVTWPRRHMRPLIAGALVAAVVAAALSSPGRSVVHSLRKAVGVENAQTELFSLPAPGQLLVTGRGGTWIVHADGSRRRLGSYRDATWSPHGLFIAATRANELVALDPKGNVRWTLARRSPRLPAWTGTRTDTRIAYVSRGALRVVAGDGTGDQLVGVAAAVRPAWRPGARHVVAYSTGRSALVYDVDRASIRLRTPVGRAAAKARVVERRPPPARLHPACDTRLRPSRARRRRGRPFGCDVRRRRGLRARVPRGRRGPRGGPRE